MRITGKEKAQQQNHVQNSEAEESKSCVRKTTETEAGESGVRTTASSGEPLLTPDAVATLRICTPELARDSDFGQKQQQSGIKLEEPKEGECSREPLLVQSLSGIQSVPHASNARLPLKRPSNCCTSACSNNCPLVASTATPPSIAERFKQHTQASGGVPKKKPPQHRRLRKYASETSFCSSPASSIGSASGLGFSPASLARCIPAASTRAHVSPRNELQHSREQLLDEDTPSPPMLITGAPLLMQIPTAADREVRGGSGRIFHVRCGAPPSSGPVSGSSTGVSSTGAVIQRLQHQQNRRAHQRQTAGAARQDSADEASASIGSASTVGSGTQTPQMQRRSATMAAQQQQLLQQQQRFKMRRPKSTGQIIIQQQGQQRKKFSETQQQGAMQDQNSVGTAGTGQSAGSGSLTIGPPIWGGNTRPAAQGAQNNNNNACSHNSVPYDPSYTSATVYSMDDSLSNLHAMPPHASTAGGGGSCGDGLAGEPRRTSNYYLFEDDSTHEFDDEGSRARVLACVNM